MSKLMSMFTGKPLVECDHNEVQCCVTEVSGSDSSAETAAKIESHNELEYKVHA